MKNKLIDEYIWYNYLIIDTNSNKYLFTLILITGCINYAYLRKKLYAYKRWKKSVITMSESTDFLTTYKQFWT